MLISIQLRLTLRCRSHTHIKATESRRKRLNVKGEIDFTHILDQILCMLFFHYTFCVRTIQHTNTRIETFSSQRILKCAINNVYLTHNDRNSFGCKMVLDWNLFVGSIWWMNGKFHDSIADSIEFNMLLVHRELTVEATTRRHLILLRFFVHFAIFIDILF